MTNAAAPEGRRCVEGDAGWALVSWKTTVVEAVEAQASIEITSRSVTRFVRDGVSGIKVEHEHSVVLR